MNKSVCENSIPKCIMVSSQKNPEEDDIFKPKNRNTPLNQYYLFIRILHIRTYISAHTKNLTLRLSFL